VNPERPDNKILAAAIGNCVHVAGILNFLNLARRVGYHTTFLGAAVGIDQLVDAIAQQQPDMVAISYRLTPQVGGRLLQELTAKVKDKGLEQRRFVFGGTPPVAKEAQGVGLFEKVFTGEEDPEEVLAYLQGESGKDTVRRWGDTIGERITNKTPYPLLRHHYGQPTVEETIDGARQIAEAEVLDVLSLGPDQNAQQYFFRPDQMKAQLDGAGGVPLRCADDLRAIYEATRCGNYPLLRIYSGTQDLIKWAELSIESIHNAWAAIPLSWYNTLDRRSERPPVQSIVENQAAMHWYAQRNIPVECNEAHQWSMRDAPDTVAVVAAYLGAYNAKAAGVRTYVAQYMFNSPASVWPTMDLAKMQAKIELIEGLHDDDFSSIRQTRAGLLSFASDLLMAKGQLAASTVIQLALKPQIVHVVGYSEGDHAATAPEVVESCQIVHGVIHNCLTGMPDVLHNPAVQERKKELIDGARILIEAIESLGNGDGDPLTDPQVLTKAIKIGLLDAPHLAGNPDAAGKVVTAPIDGAIRAIDPQTGQPLSEQQRLACII